MIRPVREDWVEKPHCDAVVEERPDPCAGGGEPFEEGETGLSQGDSVGQMVLSV